LLGDGGLELRDAVSGDISLGGDGNVGVRGSAVLAGLLLVLVLLPET
jgi:hypothetical protein